MNLIACDKHCIHQEEGYCSLEKPAAVESAGACSGCAFFQESKSGVLPPTSLSPKKAKRL